VYPAVSAQQGDLGAAQADLGGFPFGEISLGQVRGSSWRSEWSTPI
jgi:hypothetical protein